MRKVFLDVGANTGQTLLAVKDLGFDQIVCFEPVSLCWPHLEKHQNKKRIRIEHFGLWDKDTQADIYFPGAKGAGMWVKDKQDPEDEQIVESCQFRRASTWFHKNLRREDQVFLKLNCEGAECDILDDLLDTGEFAKVSHVMVDFDVKKIKALKHREAEIRKRLEAYPFPRVAFCKVVMVGPTHQARIRNWLRLVGYEKAAHFKEPD